MALSQSYTLSDIVVEDEEQSRVQSQSGEEESGPSIMMPIDTITGLCAKLNYRVTECSK